MHCECHCASLDSDNVDWMTLFTLVINLMKELLEMLSLVLQSDAVQSGWITFSWRKLILIYSVAGCMPGWTMILITCSSRSSSSSSCCLVVISSEPHQINSWLLMIDGDLAPHCWQERCCVNYAANDKSIGAGKNLVELWRVSLWQESEHYHGRTVSCYFRPEWQQYYLWCETSEILLSPIIHLIVHTNGGEDLIM